MAEARGEIIDLILANLDLDEDIKLLSYLFIHEENHERYVERYALRDMLVDLL